MSSAERFWVYVCCLYHGLSDRIPIKCLSQIIFHLYNKRPSENRLSRVTFHTSELGSYLQPRGEMMMRYDPPACRYNFQDKFLCLGDGLLGHCEKFFYYCGVTNMTTIRYCARTRRLKSKNEKFAELQLYITYEPECSISIATVKRGYPHNIFLISRGKHMSWVLIRSASARRF